MVSCGLDRLCMLLGISIMDGRWGTLLAPDTSQQSVEYQYPIAASVAAVPVGHAHLLTTACQGRGSRIVLNSPASFIR